MAKFVILFIYSSLNSGLATITFGIDSFGMKKDWKYNELSKLLKKLM